jgi:hypothetical protein
MGKLFPGKKNISRKEGNKIGYQKKILKRQYVVGERALNGNLSSRASISVLAV